MIIKKNNKFKLVFERYLKKSVVTTPTYGYGSYNSGSSSYSSRYDGIPVGDRITCYFYEWSTMSGASKAFYDIKKLVAFFDENKIEYKATDIATIRSNSFTYAVCEPGCGKLMFGTNYYTLKTELEKLRKERSIAS